MQRTRLRWAIAACTAAFAFWQQSAAASDDDIVRVEEDWRIELGLPDATVNSPQITVVCAPAGNLESPHAVLEINHRTLPYYAAGGLQLQTWHCEYCCNANNFPKWGTLTKDNEVLTFTFQTSLSDQKLHFEIVNGASETWGNFGGQGYLKSNMDTTLTSLAGYSPDASLQHSQVGYGAHRVRRLVRSEIRYYSASGQVKKDSEQKVIHEYKGFTSGN